MGSVTVDHEFCDSWSVNLWQLIRNYICNSWSVNLWQLFSKSVAVDQGFFNSLSVNLWQLVGGSVTVDNESMIFDQWICDSWSGILQQLISKSGTVDQWICDIWSVNRWQLISESVTDDQRICDRRNRIYDNGFQWFCNVGWWQWISELFKVFKIIFECG